MTGEQDELDLQTFICNDCQKECHVTEGTWPRNDFESNPIIVLDANDWEIPAPPVPFVCYDCAG